MNDEKTLAEAATEFLASLKPEEREDYRQELNKFVRWCGSDRPLRGITAPEMSKYSDSLDSSSPNSAKNAASVKAFLSYSKKRGLTESNLSVHIRIKKATGKQIPTARKRRENIAMTSDGYRELEAELDRLKKERPRIAEAIRKAAADKDFRENAPLDAAKEQQGMVEARIRELEDTLKSAVVTTGGGDGAQVSRGSTVTIYDLTHNESLCYTLVSPREASPVKGKLSVDSPTGKALLGRGQGDIVEVDAPAGILRYRIDSIEG